jgi:hypothetical protein
MHELPPEEGSNNELPDFDESVFEKIISNLDGASNEPSDAAQDPIALGEADLPEPAAEARLLEAQELSEARDLIEAVERNISSAELNFKGLDGSYFLHLEEKISTPEGTVCLVRDSYATDTYTLLDRAEKPVSAALAKNGELHIQNPEGLKEFEATESAVARGEIEGSHTYTAVKVLAAESESGPEAHLFADITRRSDGQGTTETQLELTLLRFAEGSNDTMRQSLTLDSNPSTGDIHAKNSLEGQAFVIVPDKNPGNPIAEAIPATDPMPEMTANSLQDRFNPELPINRDLTIAEWGAMVDGRLGPEHLIGE